ncbi:hypothetical protein [Candidatus Accumulibacter aalborgensis]|uniref:hypothetical protein n=1 Tax=Candidatus Accumulibacter aalborgensis TaxID=1860102 RepID=UPI001648EF37|nr:hypothetical protein [Candidatus Accumulibacter aalborgensis]
MVEVARERLERFSGDMPISEEFVVSFKKNNKMLKVDSLQKVLQLDNSVNNPIQEIAINLLCFPELPDKGGVIRLIFSGASRTISLVVGSPDVVWMQETMGSLEEQVERTIPIGLIYPIKLLPGIFYLALFFLLSTVFLSIYNANDRFHKIGFNVIPEQRAREIAALQALAKSDQEKADFVFQYLSATVPIANDSQPPKKYSLKEPRTYFVAVPMIVAVISSLWAIAFCYPLNVSAWGDWAEALDRKIEQRKWIWGEVVFATVIGVAGNLFAFGVTT